MANTYNNPELLTVDEVSTILRVDPTTVRRWLNNGSMDAVVLPHPNDRAAYRIKRETLDAILNPPKNQNN